MLSPWRSGAWDLCIPTISSREMWNRGVSNGADDALAERGQAPPPPFKGTNTCCRLFRIGLRITFF